MDEPEYGPKMLALTEKQRRYVLAMLSNPLSNPTQWARDAGYSDSSGAAKVIAHRNVHGPRSQAIMEAAQEEAARHLMTVGPVLAVGVMMQIARNPEHKRQLDAAVALADRSGFHVKTEHRVTVEHVDHARMLELARRWATELGVEEMKLVGSNVVDVEAASE